MRRILQSDKVINLLVFIVGVVVAAGAGEAIIRYQNPKNLLLKRGRKSLPFRRPHPVYGHGLRPGASGYSISPGEFRVAYRINSLGMRDHEYPAEKPPGTFRLLMLGDSMTEGFSVELKDSFVKRLERRLNASPPRAGLRYEAANLGVASFSPLLQYLFLKETLPRLPGDFLVLSLDPTDFGNDHFYQKGTTLGPEGVPLRVSHSGLLPNFLSYGRHYLETLPEGWLRESYIVRFFVWHFIRRTHEGWVRARIGNIEYDYIGWTRPGRKKGDAWDRQLGRSFSYIKRIHRLAQKAGMGFALITYPHGFMVHPQAWCAGRQKSFLECGKVYGNSLYQSLMAKCREEELTCWDFTPLFKRPDAQKLFFNVDVHMTSAGNALMAGELERRLRPILEAR
jgi:hypothetical protein